MHYYTVLCFVVLRQVFLDVLQQTRRICKNSFSIVVVRWREGFFPLPAALCCVLCVVCAVLWLLQWSRRQIVSAGLIRLMDVKGSWDSFTGEVKIGIG